MSGPNGSANAGEKAGVSLSDLLGQLTGAIRGAKLRRGQGLPSIREIAVRYGVTKAVAERAVRSLVEDGICYTEPNRGVFLAVDSAELKETATLGVVFGAFEYPRTGLLFYRQVYEGAQERIFDGRYNVMKFYEWQYKGRAQKDREWGAFADRLAGVAVLGVYDDRDCMLLRNSGLPVVVIDYDARALGVDSAVLDCGGSMLRLGRAVLAGGAAGLFFVRASWGPKSKDPASEERRRGLKRAAAEAGLALDAGHMVSVAGDGEAAELGRLATMLAELRRAGKRGAVVCEDLTRVPRVTEALAAAGLAPGCDFILGYTSPLDPPEEVAAHPAVLATFDFRQLGRAGIELLGRRMEEGPGRPVRAVLKEQIREWNPAEAGTGKN